MDKGTPLPKLVFAGAMGSIMGSLLLESFRGKTTVPGWLFLFMLMGAYAIMEKHPLGIGLIKQT